jgi:hypothetical protein
MFHLCVWNQDFSLDGGKEAARKIPLQTEVQAAIADLPSIGTHKNIFKHHWVCALCPLSKQ